MMEIYLAVSINLMILIYSVLMEEQVSDESIWHNIIYFLSMRAIFFFEGVLCSKCKKGYGLSFDLLSCQKNCNEYGGILTYVIICMHLAHSIIF